MQRKPIGSRNGINIYSRLKSKTKMKVATKKQRQNNQTWKVITEAKIAELQGICEWCGQPGSRFGDNFLSGHHIIKRRFNIHTKENCYIAHWQTCHNYIELNAIDVRIYPNKLTWDLSLPGGEPG